MCWSAPSNDLVRNSRALTLATTEEPSSEETSSEDFDKIAADFSKLLTVEQKKDFDKIVKNVEAAKTPEETINGVVSSSVVLVFACAIHSKV